MKAAIVAVSLLALSLALWYWYITPIPTMDGFSTRPLIRTANTYWNAMCVGPLQWLHHKWIRWWR